MKNDKLAKLGIVMGHMVTDAMLKAIGTGLPEAALNELWPGRTINKRCVRAIEAVLEKVNAKTAPKDKKKAGVK